MSDLKNKLIRLGSTNPELRPHLRPVLAELDRTAKFRAGQRVKVDPDHPDYSIAGKEGEVMSHNPMEGLVMIEWDTPYRPPTGMRQDESYVEDIWVKKAYSMGSYGDQSKNRSFYPDAVTEDVMEAGYAGYPDYDVSRSSKIAGRMTEFIVEDVAGNRASLVLPSKANPIGMTNPLSGEQIKYIVTDITPPGDYSKYVLGPYGETSPDRHRGDDPIKMSSRTAAYSDKIIDQVIDRMDFYKVYDKIANQEQDTAELLLNIFEKLAEELEPDRKVKMALNRLRNIVNGRLTDINDIRNQIGKAANLLGLKTPYFF